MYKNNINLRSLAKNNTSKVLFYSQSIKTSDNYRHLTMDLKAIFQQRQQKILPQQKLTLATRTQTHLFSYRVEFIGYPLGIQLWLSFKCHLPHTNDLWWKTIDLEKNCIPLPLFASRMAHCCLTQFETFMESSERIHVYLICNKGNKKCKYPLVCSMNTIFFPCAFSIHSLVVFSAGVQDFHWIFL